MARIFRHHVSPIKLTLALVDLALVVACAFLAEWLRWDFAGLEVQQSLPNIIGKLAIPAVTLPLLLGFGAYQSDALADIKVFFVRLAAAMTTSILVLAAIAYMLPALPLWRSILLLSFVLSGTSVLLAHGLFRLFVRDGFLGRRIVILGSGEDALALKKEAEAAPEAGLVVADVVSMDGNGADCGQPVTVLEDMASLPDHVAKQDCELIVIGEQVPIDELPIEPLMMCKLRGIEIMDRAAFFEKIRGYVDLDSVRADWIVFAEGFRGGSLAERGAKRALDILVSVVFAVVSAPLLLLAAIAIKLTSKGPVFYRQERVGLNGKIFQVLKLRSMRVGAEKEGAPKFAEDKDPRVTSVGRLLRRTRADEIPQVFNVLKGNMSFVGPRPERPFFVSQLEQDVPFYRERHCMKPGITGWAQIRYPYGASFEDSRRKLEYDLYYIKNYSLFLDMLIILQTLRVVLFPHGVR